MLFLYVCFFLTSTLFVYFLLILKHERKENIQRRISLFSNEEKDISEEDDDAEKASPAWKTALGAIWIRLKRKFERKIHGDSEEKLELKLLRAGKPFGMGPVEYRVFQWMATIVLPILFIVYGKLIGVDFSGMVFSAIVGVIAGFLLPSYYLILKTKQRSKKSLRELPDVLDLLTVSLEAGLGFDAALSKLVAKSEGVLSKEFQRCLEEIRLGKTRREALTGVRDRVVLEEIKSVISSILQAEKLGIGMVQVLRVQSQEVREQRKQRAEETAMKAPIKMLFPLILFIFPSLFIVLLGPAVIQFMTTFSGD